MREPWYIVGDRGTGKTVRAMAEAEHLDGLLVVANHTMVKFTMGLAHEHGIKIQTPITHSDFIDGERLRGIHSPVIVDDADLMFKGAMARWYNRPLHMVTFSVDFDRFQYLEPRNRSVLEQLRKYRRTQPGYEDVVPFSVYSELRSAYDGLRQMLRESQRREEQAIMMAGAMIKMTPPRTTLDGGEDAE